jgi:dynein heavy chain
MDRQKLLNEPLHAGRKAVLMVDDLNMPVKEKYGAQPPIEIFRQMIDVIAYGKEGLPYAGWYDRKDSQHPFKYICDCLLMACMGTPGGGRTFITPRFLMHFLLIGFPLLEDDNMTKIFQTIVDWKFQKDGYGSDVMQQSKKVVLGTLEMYKGALTNLLPTPLKVHYTFNLRDFSKIVQGFLMMSPEGFGEQEAGGRAIRLWGHECFRILGDRLSLEEDRKWLLDHMRETCKKTFGKTFDDVFKNLDKNGDGKVDALEEVINTPFCPLQEKFHTFVLRGLRNISEAP